MIAANLVTDTGGDLDLDFHAIMHWGADVALDKNYVPARSQRTRSVLSFFAQDGASHTLVYANADLTKATQAREVLVFAQHWKTLTGRWPARLVMDQKVTTQEVLAELDTRGINFITLRMRSTSLLRHIESLPTSAWSTVRLDRDGAYNRPKVVDEIATLSNYPGTVRQLVVRGLGRDTATVIITNDRTSSIKQIIERYARRMNIEQRLAEAIRSFHLDALSGASRSTSTSTSYCPCSPGPSAPRCAAGSPATTTPPPTPCNDASSPPQEPSSTTATPSPSDSTGAPTHRSCAKPTSPTPPPSPGGADDGSTSSTTDQLGVELAARKSALASRAGHHRWAWITFVSSVIVWCRLEGLRC